MILNYQIIFTERLDGIIKEDDGIIKQRDLERQVTCFLKCHTTKETSTWSHINSIILKDDIKGREVPKIPDVVVLRSDTSTSSLNRLRMGKGESKTASPTIFSIVNSTTVGIIPQHFLTISLNYCHIFITLLSIPCASTKLLNLEPRPPFKKLFSYGQVFINFM